MTGNKTQASNEEKILISKRENLFRRAQILYDLIAEVKKDRTKLSIFKARFKDLPDTAKAFYDICDRINELTLISSPDSVPETQQLSSFDTLYYEICAFADQFITTVESQTHSAKPSESESKKLVQPKLPKIELPIFDSSIKNWITFYDQFRSLIHDNKLITPVEKFHYLLSCVSGPALSIVRSLPLSDKNYAIVWGSLIEKYHNKRVIGSNLLDSIFNLSPYSRENISNLNSFLENFGEYVTALKALQLSDLSDFILLHLGLRVLPAETRKNFELNHLKTEMPTFEQLIIFVQNQAKVLEVSGVVDNKIRPFKSTSTDKQITYKPSTFTRKPLISLTSAPPNVNTLCPVCKLCHTIYRCPTFNKATTSERRIEIRKLKYCFNCLRGPHMIYNCRSKTRCLNCGAHHHTLLCDTLKETSNTLLKSNTDIDASTSSALASTLPLSNNITTSEIKPDNIKCNMSSNSTEISTKPFYTVLLGTTVVHIKAFSGEYLPFRALIDSGAQSSFITMHSVQKLGLPIRKCNIPVAGLGLSLISETKGLTSCTLKPVHNNKSSFFTDAIVLPRITCAMPSTKVPETIYKSYKHLLLADPHFDTPNVIDFLIGADLFPYIFDGNKKIIKPGLPLALHSIFGWIIMGPYDNTLTSLSSSVMTLLSTESPVVSDNTIKRFWEVEEPPSVIFSNPDDSEAENIFENNFTCDPSGRYVVPILLKPNFSHASCTASYSQALNRLKSLERRLDRHPNLKEEYQHFLDEYLRLGHMSRVPYTPLSSDNYVIPHHAVFKESSSTRLRVVFDGSSRPLGLPSLNEFLYTGPKLQHNIVDIILRFRLHFIIFIADICKMYRQILLKTENRRFQHIIWRKSSSSPVEEYELNTVTYGLASSPYLALRALKQLSSDKGKSFPKAADILNNDVYVDDIISGCKSVEEAVTVIDELIKLLHIAGFQLKRWSSNCPEVIKIIPEDHRETPLAFDSDGGEIIKVLGLQFNPRDDCFSYKISRPNLACTKRNILSFIARIYDPLGWLCPIVFRMKSLIQHLWRLGLNWDEDVPTFISNEWNLFTDQINYLSNLKLNRQILQPGYICLRLVGFCDASERGYCGVVYLHIEAQSTSYSHLLIAKSKVAPLKTMTIPRLELSGAFLLSKLLHYANETYKRIIPITDIIAFTDSTTVLSWLKTPPHLLKTFVSSRVIKILDTVPPSSWSFVTSDSNPADCASRGLRPQEFLHHPLWFNGPSWLAEPFGNWPNIPFKLKQNELPELKDKSSINSFLQSNLTDKSVSWIPLQNYSTFMRLQRITAWCLRYCNNCRSVKSNSLFLSSDELERALIEIVKAVQQEAFASEFQLIKSGKDLPVHFKRLIPFFDSSGCLRVGGRLKNSIIPEASIHPYLLPKKHHVTNLIISHYHTTYLHVGPRALQSIISRKFWIFSAREVIRSRLSKCLTCFKAKPTFHSPLMGNLPSSRVTPSRPFTNVGVDFGGPFLIKEGYRRNARVRKSYLCLFVCMTTKAVHLEVVSDLTTTAFLAALDRFFARRGICSNIYSDCGTNFVGAKHHLADIYSFLQNSKEETASKLAQKSIKWWLHPPAGPHIGGLYEAGIRSAKYHLKRTIGQQSLNYEEISTLFCRIEAIMNSRPLCSLSPDPSELDVLTPGHFLIGQPLIAIPESNLLDTNINRLTRWQLISHSVQHFWKRWSREYLHTLQQRSKWFTPQRNLEVGDLVLLIEDRLPPLQWRTARVIKVHPGSDGTVRVASVKTSQGTFLRPAVKLCPLPLQ